MTKVARIPLTARRKVVGYALVDITDLPLVDSHPWHLSYNGYPVGSRNLGGSRQMRVRMNRVIAGLENGDPRVAHHINGDKLDNRRANLEVCDKAQHQHTHALGRPVGYRKEPPFRVRVQIHGHRYELGYCDTEAEARTVIDGFVDGFKATGTATVPSNRRWRRR